MNTHQKSLTMLGIETSCDETAAAIVRRRPDGQADILSNRILSQISEHAPYGGVVPEIAARSHVDHVDYLILEAMSEAGVEWKQLDGVAATSGPGLIGGVMVGLMAAKAVALAHGLPLVGVNHLEGHALSVRLTEDADFPYLLLLASGGHTQLLGVEGVGHYHQYGSTIDDALGEAFDKTAKLLDLGFPGGPAVERYAESGNPIRFELPRPLKGTRNPDFSFSGLKTALRRIAETEAPLSESDVSDLCASFQEAAADVIEDRTRLAMRMFRKRHEKDGNMRLVMAGGVAANQMIRGRLSVLCEAEAFELLVPPVQLCTDNGAMIAWAGAERLALGLTDPLSIPARARWPLQSLSDAL